MSLLGEKYLPVYTERQILSREKRQERQLKKIEKIRKWKENKLIPTNKYKNTKDQKGGMKVNKLPKFFSSVIGALNFIPDALYSDYKLKKIQKGTKRIVEVPR
jgi:hypothetical protein